MRQIVEYPWCNPSCRIAEMRTYSDNGLYVIATPRLLVPYKRLQNRGLPSGARPSRKAQTEANLAGCQESRCRNSRCLNCSMWSGCLWWSTSCRAKNEPRIRFLRGCVRCARAEPMQTDAAETRPEH